MPRKKNPAARYAFIGLIVALIACVASGLLALVKGTTALKIFVPDDAQGTFIDTALYISIVLLVVGLAAYAILSPNTVRRFLSGRQARYGSNTLVMGLAFFGILFVVNLLAYQNPKSWDFTEGKQHTLAPETLQALSTLPDKVTAIAFFTTRTPTDSAKQLLTSFQSNSRGKFDYRFVDPTSDPALANKYKITSDGQIVLTMGNSSQLAAFADETEIDKALILLISPQTRTVYFLTGHGEADINGTDNTGMSQASQTLQNKSYTVKSLNLATASNIPDDAKVIVIAGPKSPLLDPEVALLKAYVNRGGSLIIMEDPTMFTNFGTSPDPLADYLKSDWGISFDNDVVIDTYFTNAFIAVGDPASYNKSQAVTQNLHAIVVMPEARSLTVSENPPQGATVSELMTTSQQRQNWGETDFTSIQNQQVSFDKTADIAGPLPLAAGGEGNGGKSRIIAVGNSLFATDQYFSAYANSSVFVNAVDWAAREQNLINITPRQPVTRTFNAPQQLQLIIILLSSVIVIPGLVVAAGISSWVARRRQG